MRQRGFSLTEVLVASLLATVVIAGIFALYLQSTRNRDQQVHVQARALQRQLVLSLLQESFHNAGFSGCLAGGRHFTSVNVVTDRRELPISIRRSAVLGSDIVVVRHLSRDAITLGNSLKPGDALPNEFFKSLSPAGMWLVSCDHAEPVSLGHGVEYAYPRGSLVGNIHTTYWYVRKTKHLRPDGKYIDALYRQTGQQRAEEVLSDVDSISATLLTKAINIRLHWQSDHKSTEVTFALPNMS